jgi:hypothetical protein
LPSLSPDLIDKAGVILDYYKLELVQLLPEAKNSITKAAKQSDPAKYKKKLKKAKKNLRGIIDETKK